MTPNTIAALRRNFPAVIVLSILTMLIFAPSVYNQLWGSSRIADYKLHTDFARELITQRSLYILSNESGEAVPITHVLWHFLIGIPSFLLGGNGYKTGSFVFGLTQIVLAAVLLFGLFMRGLKDVASISGQWMTAALLALALLLVAPISVFTAPFQMLYLPYIGINVYHNPTINLLKPFAIVQFVAAATALAAPRVISGRALIGLAALTGLSMFAKPSYGLCLVPAITILAAKRLVIDRMMIDWRTLAFGLAIPTTVILALQYLLVFGSPSDGGLVIGYQNSFHFLYLSNETDWMHYLIPIWAILSMLFPLTVLVAYHRKALTHVPLMLGWLSFAFGLVLTYFVNESGSRGFHGNFTWSGQITLFILFVATVWFLIENRHEFLPVDNSVKLDARAVLISLVFSLHLLSGIAWWWVETTSNANGWW